MAVLVKRLRSRPGGAHAHRSSADSYNCPNASPERDADKHSNRHAANRHPDASADCHTL